MWFSFNFKSNSIHSMEELRTIVIDNGSSMIKSGIAGDELPRSVFPSVIGRPKYAHTVAGGQNKDFYVGDEACAKAGILLLDYPIEHGIVKNWYDMEKIWKFTFQDEFHVDPYDSQVLLTEPIKSPKTNRERMIEIMLETFKFHSFYIALQPCLSLMTTGSNTGLVLEIGDSVSQIGIVYESYYIPESSRRFIFSGRFLSSRMMNLLRANSKSIPELPMFDSLIINEIKEKKAYVAIDYQAELQKSIEEIKVNHEFPDGKILPIDKERFQCPEVLFNPSLENLDCEGIHQYVYNSIMSSDLTFRPLLYRNIILSGGSSMLQGFSDRMEKEIKDLAPSTIRINVIAQPERKYAVWIGGSIFASLATFPQSAITQDEYNENGLNIVHRKCS